MGKREKRRRQSCCKCGDSDGEIFTCEECGKNMHEACGGPNQARLDGICDDCRGESDGESSLCSGTTTSATHERGGERLKFVQTVVTDLVHRIRRLEDVCIGSARSGENVERCELPVDITKLEEKCADALCRTEVLEDVCMGAAEN